MLEIENILMEVSKIETTMKEGLLSGHYLKK